MREEHLGAHSHGEQLSRKEVTRSKEKHTDSLEGESSWLPVCLYLVGKSLASLRHLQRAKRQSSVLSDGNTGRGLTEVTSVFPVPVSA